MTDEEVNNVKDSLNEYFKLKQKFEEQTHINKQQIINNTTLSNKDKRAKFVKILPKCVNCKNPSKKGTIFSITYVPETDKNDSYRIYKASCGYLQDPCNLNIEIHVGTYNIATEYINDIRNDIINVKNSIINTKNRLLFGLISTETALNLFTQKTDELNTITSIYENYLDIFIKKTENIEDKNELEHITTQSYENIAVIKDYIRKMNQENNIRYANDAVEIYINILEPLLKKIRNLKYKKNYVHCVDNKCVLVQQKYNIDDILINGYSDRVISFDVGFNKPIKTSTPPKEKEPSKKDILVYEPIDLE